MHLRRCRLPSEVRTQLHIPQALPGSAPVLSRTPWSWFTPCPVCAWAGPLPGALPLAICVCVGGCGACSFLAFRVCSGSSSVRPALPRILFNGPTALTPSACPKIPLTHLLTRKRSHLLYLSPPSCSRTSPPRAGVCAHLGRPAHRGPASVSVRCPHAPNSPPSALTYTREPRGAQATDAGAQGASPRVSTMRGSCKTAICVHRLSSACHLSQLAV